MMEDVLSKWKDTWLKEIRLYLNVEPSGIVRTFFIDIDFYFSKDLFSEPQNI